MRLIDADGLLNKLNHTCEMMDFLKITSPVSEAIEKTVIPKINEAPTIEPKFPSWRDPDKDPPKVETEVLILYRNDIDGYSITTAHYEDGSVFSQDSAWYWEDLPDWGTYDEERDDYKIPEGWWEYRHFNPDDVYNNKIDCPVVGWMPLPPKDVKKCVDGK